MSIKRTKAELEKENEDLREQVALLRQVVGRMLVAPPAPALVTVPVPMPTVAAPNPLIPFGPSDTWPTIICGDIDVRGSTNLKCIVTDMPSHVNTAGCTSWMVQ